MIAEVLLERHDQLDLAEYCRIAFDRAPIVLGGQLLDTVQRGRDALLAHLASGVPAYGITTGLGFLASRPVAADDQAAFQRSILAGRAAGTGPPLSEPVVRGATLLPHRWSTVPRHMVFANARVIDGTGRAPIERAMVRLESDRIVAVNEGSVTPPEDSIDLEGRTLMPGLIDAHAHLSSDISRSPGFGPPPALHGEPPRPRELGYFVLAKTARALLAAGVTSIRDVGSYDDEAIVLREAVRLGLVEGPRILSCGRIISATAPGGAIFTTMYREADGPDDMRKAVREQLRRGADFIKLMATGARSVLAEDPEPAQMTAAELAAIVEEAHRLGVRVAAHVEGLAGARLAVDAGVNTIEHGLSLHREPALLDVMAQAGIVLVPTLSTFHDLAERFTDEFAPALVEQAKRQLEEAYLTLVAARAAGVTLAMGHDSGPPGDNAVELVRMVEGGLSPLEGIAAATQGSARALGLPDVGTVCVGAVADLIVLDGDPVADVGVLREPARIWMVVQEGRIVAGPGRVPELTPA